MSQSVNWLRLWAARSFGENGGIIMEDFAPDSENNQS